MSTGGVIKPVTVDGKADRLATAIRLLNRRIQDIMCGRTQTGETGITFVNVHFKMFSDTIRAG